MRFIVILCLLPLLTHACCPSTPGEALTVENKQRLLECSEQTLRYFYNANDCCIVNLAECNYIEAAWKVSFNVLRHEPLCPRINHDVYK